MLSHLLSLFTLLFANLITRVPVIVVSQKSQYYNNQPKFHMVKNGKKYEDVRRSAEKYEEAQISREVRFLLEDSSVIVCRLLWIVIPIERIVKKTIAVRELIVIDLSEISTADR
jgi:hypothetical protein